MSDSSKSVIIVGAGVFGLSTALHLARAGYSDVTVFDYQPYHRSLYDHDKGCDSASSDINKIYRCSYGKELEYQRLAFSGRETWLQWNDDIRACPHRNLPLGLKSTDQLFEPNGFVRLSDGKLSRYDEESLKMLESEGVRHHQHVFDDERDMARLRVNEDDGWLRKIKAFPGVAAGTMTGYLDTSAGFIYADKACIWARHLAVEAGVKFVLDATQGRLKSLIESEKRIKGIVTADGLKHTADVVVIACGPWAPTIVPESSPIVQATAGSVVSIHLPKSRPDLWRLFAPDAFPTWAYGLTGHESQEYGGFYGFPRNEHGVIKIGYRGRKFTNIARKDAVSVPITKHTDGPKRSHLSRPAIQHLKRAIDHLFPDLRDLGVSGTRLCWYTDSFDNSFLIDYVPGYSNTLFIASGESGHGFKFLPVLGKHIVNALEGRKDEFTDVWKWRDGPRPYNPDLAAFDTSTEEDWQWGRSRGAKL